MADHESTPTFESMPETAEPERPEQPGPEQPDTRPEPDRVPGTPAEPDEAPDPEKVVQPADLPEAKAAEGKSIEMRTPSGALTIRPGQVTLDTHQRAALVAINIDVKRDPQIEPHVRPFIHMCQIRGLDPWAREAYLIGRGRGEKRKFTMQVGIDGYRKMANATGRFLRVKDVLWTGTDDDDKSYRMDANGVMRRVWWDQWPASRSHPGAAKVIIEHLDADGAITETEGIADWDMFAPYNDVWEGSQGNRRPKMGPDGKPVRELTDMWTKGGPFMLAKCAEALAYRKAFPASLNGFYVAEEMHRADAVERDREAAEQRTRRVAAYQAATGGQVTAGPQGGAPAAAEPAPAAQGASPEAPAEPSGGPERVGDTAAAVVAAVKPQGPEEAAEGPVEGTVDLTARLHAELAFQGEVLGHAPRVLAKRVMTATRRDLDALTEADLMPLVTGLRPAVVSRLTAEGRPEVEKYAALGLNDVADLDDLLVYDGDVHDAVVVPDDVDPTKPHAFVNDGGICGLGDCGLFEDEPIHKV